MVFVGRHRDLSCARVQHRFEVGLFKRFESGLLICLVHARHDGTVVRYIHRQVNDDEGQQRKTHQHKGHGFFHAGLLQHLLQGPQNTCGQRGHAVIGAQACARTARGQRAARSVAADVGYVGKIIGLKACCCSSHGRFLSGQHQTGMFKMSS